MTAPVIAVCGIGLGAALWNGLPVNDALIPEGKTFAEMVDNVRSKLPDRCSIAAHSLGVPIAIEIAIEAPGQIERLALICGCVDSDSLEKHEARRTLTDFALKDFESASRKLAAAMLSIAGRNDTALRDRLHGMIEKCGPVRFAEQQYAAMSRPDRSTDLAKIACPTLVVYGTEDGIVEPQRSAALAVGIPGVREFPILKCGHAPQIEKPEELKGLMSEWFGIRLPFCSS